MSAISSTQSPPLLTRCEEVLESRTVVKRPRKASEKTVVEKEMMVNIPGGIRYAVPDNFFVVSSEEEISKGKGLKCVRPVFVNNPGTKNLVDVRYFLPLMDLTRTEYIRNDRGEVLVKPTRGMSFSLDETDALINGIKQVKEYLERMN